MSGAGDGWIDLEYLEFMHILIVFKTNHLDILSTGSDRETQKWGELKTAFSDICWLAPKTAIGDYMSPMQGKP